MTFSTFASPGVSLQGGGGSGSGTASLPISGNGATITTSTPLINGTQTWNSGATTFTSLLLNVTDTASAAGSLLMDLQVGGSSRFSVRKDGTVALLNGTFYPNFGGAGLLLLVDGSNMLYFRNSANRGTELSSGLYYGWSSGAAASNGADLFLTRRAAANLRLGAADAAAPVAQTLSVQSVVAGTSNTAGANLTITGSQGTGTGAGGSIVFQVAPAGAVSNGVQNALATALTIASDRNATFANRVTIGENIWASGSSLSLVVSGSAGLAVTASQTLARLSLGITDDSSNRALLFLDAANTLALRNGANAQFLRVYSTYTDASNYERGAINTGADFVELAAETAGTGDDNLDVRLTPAGTGNVRFGTHTATADTAVSGYIEIKDAGGTIRKLAVIT